jgi:hypothetical protein
MIYQTLATPLPEEWKLCVKDKKIFFFNVSDGTTMWEHPLDIQNQQTILQAKGFQGEGGMQGMEGMEGYGGMEGMEGMEDMMSPNMA